MPEFSKPREAFLYHLGSALRMERTVLEILELSDRAAEDDSVLDLVGRLQADASARIDRLERIFGDLGEDVVDSPSPAMHGIKKGIHEESELMSAKVSDLAILQGAVEAGYYELGVFVNLEVTAEALGHHQIAASLEDFAATLRQTLEDSVAIQARLASRLRA